MLKSLVKISGILAGLILSGAAYAVGMGGINVVSALGQPLNVEIELVSVDKADESSLSAHLASPDAFKGAGIDYPYSLPKLKFQIANHADGTPYLKLTSKDAVNDPFVSLLVELDWASGKLLREYTFLLDPPDYHAVQPKAEPVQPIAPAAAAPAPQQPPMEAPAAAAQPAEMPAHAAAPMEQKASAAKPVSHVASGPITVKRGDTLTKIAAQIKEPDVTLEQMLVALYRANVDQFDGKNMNRLRAGKILRQPEEAQLAKLSNKEAVHEIHVQAADWHAYRQKLAAASAGVSEQAPQQEVSGKISTSVADKTPAAKQSAKEVLKLSKGEAPGDKTVAGGKAQAMQDRIHALEEEAVARNKELQDSKDRIALLEKNIKEMQRLLDLKAPPALPAKPAEAKPEVKPEPAKVEAKPAPVAAPASQPAAASSVAAASAVQPAAKPKPKHKAVAPKVVPPPPSLMDEILGEPLYLAGGAAALLALGGLGFMMTRRKGGKPKKDIQGALAVGETTGSHIAEPVMPSPETGDFTQAAAPETPQEEASAEEVDPLSEAELFLNFGRDVQAEEVLKEALSKDPNNLKIQLKLLGIYANRNDANAFSSIAQRVKESGDADAWEQAAAMGRKIDPTNPLYGGAGEAAAAEAAAGAAVTDFVLDEGKAEEPAALDFDLGFGAAEPAAPAVAATTETTAILSPQEVRAAQEAPMDFDVTSTHPDLAAPLEMAPSKTEAPVKDESVLDFDVTSTNPALAAMPEGTAAEAPAEKKTEAASLGDLIFDVTSTNPSMAAPEPESVAPAASKPMDFDLGDISLNLEGVGETKPAAPAAGGKDERWHEVATKLDLAKAYQEMGDAEGAREILEEVLRDGDEQQREAAQGLLDQMSS